MEFQRCPVSLSCFYIRFRVPSHLLQKGICQLVNVNGLPSHHIIDEINVRSVRSLCSRYAANNSSMISMKMLANRANYFGRSIVTRFNLHPSTGKFVRMKHDFKSEKEVRREPVQEGRSVVGPLVSIS